MVIVLCVIAVPLLLLLIWALMSPGKIRTYKEPGSLSEKFIMEINGAPNGFFINSRNTDNPVLLLVSSGPGTDDYVFTDKYKDMRLEDDFTVVYWDYRWMGIAYDSKVRKNEITLDNLLDDTQAVTEYLKERFGKEKIYIMGFSGGTHIALREASRHPENYYAYIGMAQCVTDSAENDTLMYDFMKKVFTERGDKKNLSKLESSVEHVDGRCYTLKEKINYVIGMKMYRTTPLASELDGFDYRQSMKEIKVPVYFISGEYDYNCPWELVKEYSETVSAPSKGFYKIQGSAHSPLWENPEETCRILREIKEKTQNG